MVAVDLDGRAVREACRRPCGNQTLGRACHASCEDAEYSRCVEAARIVTILQAGLTHWLISALAAATGMRRRLTPNGFFPESAR